MTTTLLTLSLTALALLLILLILVIRLLLQTRRSPMDPTAQRITELKGSLDILSHTLGSAQDRLSTANEKAFALMSENLDRRVAAMEKTVELLSRSVEKSLKEIGEANEKKLGQIQATVDEKLQKTLEERISRSFSQVSRQLEQVYQSLGEMQSLKSDVSSLSRALTNVKTRGILGEIQLGAILEEILTPEQYATNVVTVKGSRDPVEFAVKLPGDGEGSHVWLPIDSKFPLDCYHRLEDAYESGDAAAVNEAGKLLDARLKAFAKDIHQKYVHVPETTEFAILFLPTEGLYAHAVRRGMAEILQSEYKINLAGPTTMAALLNSLQMGFRTLAIQRRTSEVWQVLGGVKTEFEKFAATLEKAQSRIDQAHKELDDLVGARTRMIRRKLQGVEALDEKRTKLLFEEEDNG